MGQSRDLLDEFLQMSVVVERTRSRRTKSAILGALVVLATLALLAFWFAIQTKQQASELEAAATTDALRLIALSTSQSESDSRRQAAEAAQATAESAANAELQARENADRQAEASRLALSQQLASQAQALLGEYPQRSLLLAVEAIAVHMRESESPTRSAQAALRQGLADVGGRGIGRHAASISAIAVAPDDKTLATGSTDGAIGLWSLETLNSSNAEIVDAHESSVTVLAFDASTRFLVSGAEDGTAILWDLVPRLSVRSNLRTDQHHPISAAAISQDGSWLAVGGDDGSVILWSLKTRGLEGTPIRLQDHNSRITALVFDGAGSHLAAVDVQGMGVQWELEQEKSISSSWSPISYKFPMTVKAVSPAGSWLVTTTRDGHLALVPTFGQDLSVDSTALLDHESDILSVVFSPDGSQLLARSVNRTMIWDLATSEPISTTQSELPLSADDSLHGIALTGGKRWLITTHGDNNVRLWDLAGPTPNSSPTVLFGHEGPVTVAVLSPSSRWLVTGSKDHTVRVWDLSRPSLRLEPALLPHPHSPGTKLSVSEDGRWLATAGHNATVRIWDLSAGTPLTPSLLFPGPESGITAISISPHGEWVAIASWERVLRVWDLRGPGAAEVIYTSPRHSDVIRAVAISSDGTWLGSASDDGTVEVWAFNPARLADGPNLVLRHNEAITSIAFSPNGNWLILGSQDGVAYLSNLSLPDSSDTPFTLHADDGAITAIDTSPDGHLVAIGYLDGKTSLWALTGEGPGETINSWEDHQDAVMAVTFTSKDQLITAGGDGSIHVWHVSSDGGAEVPLALQEHTGLVLAAAASSDGHWLVSSSVDGTVLLWNMWLRELVDLACVTAGRNLSRQEWALYFGDQEYRPICDMLPEPPSPMEPKAVSPEANLAGAQIEKPIPETNSTAECLALFTDMDDRKLAFISDRDGNANIYVLNGSDREPTRVTTYPGDDLIQAWLPDDRILFASDRGEGFRLYAVNSDGTGTDFFNLQAPTGAERVTMSPNFDKLAYARGEPGNWEIYVDHECVQHSDAEQVFLVWSHDSSRLALEYVRSGDRRQLWVLDTLDRKMVPITSSAYVAWNAAWAPNDEWIAFVANIDNDPDIYLTRPDGSDLVQLTANDDQDILPIWSPDSQWLAFFQAHEGDEQVCRIATDGSDLRCLFTLPRANDSWELGLGWTLNSQWVCYSLRVDGQRDIFCRSTEDESVCRLTSSPSDEWNPSWSY